jgi:hypothetical protein
MDIDDRVSASPLLADPPRKMPWILGAIGLRLSVLVPCLLIVVLLDVAFSLTQLPLSWGWDQRLHVFGWIMAGPIVFFAWGGQGPDVVSGAAMIACIFPPALIAHLVKPNLVTGVATVIGSVFWVGSGILFMLMAIWGA